MLTAILFGIIEGLTEFIPVSSTAHLLLLGKALKIPDGSFLEMLAISIQTGAILAAVFYFWTLVWRTRSLIPKVIVAFIPTALAGIFLYPIIKPLFASTLTIALALIAGGVVLLVVRPIEGDADVRSISYKDAFLIGLFQIASFIPGVSRAGATLIGGSLARMPRSIIVPFSFLLAIPTIVGAGAVELLHLGSVSGKELLLTAIGAAVAFIVALFSIRFFIKLLTTAPLSWFGWYRIALGILALAFLI